MRYALLVSYHFKLIEVIMKNPGFFKIITLRLTNKLKSS